MATASEVMAFAGKWVGYSRYEDPEQGTVFGRWYAKLTNSPWFGTTGVPYCMMFVTCCLYLGTFEQKAKCIGTPSAGCTGSMKLARNSGKLKHIEAGSFGDVVYFDWSRGGYWSDNADHVGFIRSVDNVNRIAYTREGNVSGCVKDCVRSFADIVGCVTPEYSGSAPSKEDEVYGFPTIQRGSVGDAVKLVQSALNIRQGSEFWVDGEFGSYTDSEVRRWQRNHNLIVDGIVGAQTWPSILGK